MMLRPLTLIMALCISLPTMAADVKLVDCRALRNQCDTTKISQADMQQCMVRGYMPPLCWRLDAGNSSGSKAPGSSFETVRNVANPAVPPALAGAAPSVSNSKIAFSISFPPWAGFPCQLPGGINVCGGNKSSGGVSGTGTVTPPSPTGTGSGTGTAAGSCPIDNDTAGTFGTRTAIGSSGNYTLSCGGGVPLTTYQMTLTHNPTGMVATEYNSPYIWVYNNSGSSYTGGATAIPLPTYLCMPTGKGGAMEKSIDLGAPRAQMITYNGTTSAIAIRLIPNGTGVDTSGDSPLSPATNNEQYLMIPIQGGVPQVPQNCASQSTYYLDGHHITGDITIETPVQVSCEGTTAQCSAAGVSSTPTVASSCDMATIYLSAPPSLPTGATSCTGMTQILGVDRPNLYIPPSETASFATISGRSGVMAATSSNSLLYLPTDNTIRLPQSGQSFTFPEGATLGTNDGQLIMYGPATVSGSGQVILTAGGEFRNASGSTTATYPANSAVSPNITFPLLISATRNVKLGAGYQVPTQPSPYILTPVTGG